jgi:ATP-dependent Clp protease adaptor protein ClpS
MSDSTTVPVRKTKEDQEEKTKRQPPYNVVLLDDDDHSYAYVIALLQQLFGYTKEKGYQLAKEVDTTGRVIVLTTTKEHAELKQDQIHSFGPDPLIPRCKGSMSAVIEAAPG